MKVLKFGGTSVGTVARMHDLPTIIAGVHSDCKLVVLSALSGTTNKLVNVCSAFENAEVEEAEAIIAALEVEYINIATELLSEDVRVEESIHYIKSRTEHLKSFARRPFTNLSTKSILAQGELLSAYLFHQYLQEIGTPSVLLNALDFMILGVDGEPDVLIIRERIHQVLAKYPEDTLFITQGYICLNHFGEVDNLRRGGSDYTASLLGAALYAEEVQIWTDIDGFHNNDPRYVQGTSPIPNLSFDEAAELAYFGAKILHPQSVFPAQKFNIPVRLLNTLNPENPGTLISETGGNQHKIVAIAAKDGITAIRIQSSRMLLAYGFLRSVFEVFEQYKTPIDMITTSEVAVSLTIDQKGALPEILKALEAYGTVEVDENQSIVCIVGDFKQNRHGFVSIVTDAVKHIPLRIISYGGSDHNVSLLVPEADKLEVLKSLHSRLF